MVAMMKTQYTNGDLSRETMPPKGARKLSFESIRVDKDSPVPAYIQIAEGLKALLKSNAFPAGHPLPPERALCEAFGVSRMTLRQATSILDQEGLIVSHRGRGTFVAHIRLRKEQQELRSFSEEIRARGGKPESRLLSFETCSPSSELQDFFGITRESRLYEISRLRLSSGVPIALEVAKLPQALCPGLERFDLEKNSLYRVLEEFYGLRLGSCVEEISAQIPSASDRRLLAIPKDAVALVIHRKTFTDAGQALEMTRTVYRGDLYSAVVHSVRPQKDTGAKGRRGLV